MTQGPENPYEPDQPHDGDSPYGQTPPPPPPPPPYGEPQNPPPSYDQPSYDQPAYNPQAYGQPAQPAYGQAPYGQQPYGQMPYQTYGAGSASPGAPYGVHPVTGIPYSDKSKVVAGLLQILVPFGIGRFYIGDSGIGIAQLLVTIFTCGIGALWPVIDGIIMLASDSKDANGLMLRS